MTGPKLNEKSYVAGERSGTKSTAKYVRSSASKARVVLDLIRGLDVVSADQVLQFTDRHIAHDVRKVLASAVANAVNNDSQDAEELFVIACFADEGPTLRRFRPRARGRATRINKRSCHITVIVARLSDDRLSVVQARRERQGGVSGSGRPQSSATSRRSRVERSRKRSASDQPTVDEVQDANDELEDADQPVTEAPAEVVALAGDWAGSAEPLDDVSEMPEGYPIKGNAQSMLYHEPDTRYYAATKAEVWFDTVESAEAAGFAKPGGATKDADDASDDDAENDDAAGAADDAADEAEEN